MLKLNYEYIFCSCPPSAVVNMHSTLISNIPRLFKGCSSGASTSLKTSAKRNAFVPFATRGRWVGVCTAQRPIITSFLPPLEVIDFRSVPLADNGVDEILHLRLDRRDAGASIPDHLHVVFDLRLRAGSPCQRINVLKHSWRCSWWRFFRYFPGSQCGFVNLAMRSFTRIWHDIWGHPR